VNAVKASTKYLNGNKTLVKSKIFLLSVKPNYSLSVFSDMLFVSQSYIIF